MWVVPIKAVQMFVMIKVNHPHTCQLVKTQEHQKCHQLTPGSYPITTTYIESPPHIWDDFVGVYTPSLLALMGVLLQQPLKNHN
jgi:hypothetical protein